MSIAGPACTAPNNPAGKLASQPVPACLPYSPAGVASQEELLDFKQVFSRDTDGGRRWFVYGGMRRCLLEGLHSDVQAWLRQYRGLAPPALPPLPPQQ